ncbi:hypothetical protein HZC08_01830, partial [Candidatus Micrarchaeota archaeon]|nr:hypothetical protein [Candidatus Micrarchaeota archaeon]
LHTWRLRKGQPIYTEAPVDLFGGEASGKNPTGVGKNYKEYRVIFGSTVSGLRKGFEFINNDGLVSPPSDSVLLKFKQDVLAAARSDPEVNEFVKAHAEQFRI